MEHSTHAPASGNRESEVNVPKKNYPSSPKKDPEISIDKSQEDHHPFSFTDHEWLKLASIPPAYRFTDRDKRKAQILKALHPSRKRMLVEAEPILRRFSSLENGLSCCDGVAEMKRLLIENCLLHTSRNIGTNPTRDYFCNLQGGQGRSYIDLMEKLLSLRNQLMEEENEYISMVGGKCPENKEDALQNIARRKTELDCAEKVYLISRGRFFYQRSTRYATSNDNDLLNRMIRQRKEIMKLEGEYVELLQAGAKFTDHTLSEYSEHVLQRAVSSRRECLGSEQLYFLKLSLDVQPIKFKILQKVEEEMEYLWARREVYPIWTHNINIDNKIINLREKYLKLEDKYLCLLQERHHNTSFDVRQIRSEYSCEHLLELTLRWRTDLTLFQDIHTSKEEKSTHEFVKLFEKFKEAEEEYCKLIRERHVTILDSTSSMDVTQIYAKYNHPELLEHIKILRMKMKKLMECDHRDVYNNLEHFKIVTIRIMLHELEDQYFLRLEKNVAAKHFFQLQQIPLETKGGESSVIDIVPRHEKITSVEPSIGVRRWEIRRCIVLGGLFESITSLVIITSASSANLSDGNILALALTNLITGLFFIRHEISGLHKKSQMSNKCSRIQVEDNRYYKELVKEKLYYVLYFVIAFLSFSFCGLVAPLVYTLLSLKIRNKNLKMLATAGASLSCTTFLAIQKVHILKPKSKDVYWKTAATYLCVGVGAFVISYLAGYMFGNILE